MSNENNKMQVDIENLFKQNVNDLSSIKELYRKLKEMEEKISQIKYIDTALSKKLQKDYDKLKNQITDENLQIKLNNDIETIITQQVKITNDIETINSQMEHKASEVDLIVERERINNIMAVKDSTDNLETADIRVGADGKTYGSGGEAVREQLKNKTNNNLILNSVLLLESGSYSAECIKQDSSKRVRFSSILKMKKGDKIINNNRALIKYCVLDTSNNKTLVNLGSSSTGYTFASNCSVVIYGGYTDNREITDFKEFNSNLLIISSNCTENYIINNIKHEYIGEVKETIYRENKYANLKWVIFGDSYSDENNSYATKRYFDFIAEDLGIPKTNIKNLAVSGSGYKRTKSNFVVRSTSSSMPTDFDFVTIFGSGNDCNIDENYNFGNVTDTTTDTICGCVNVLINNILDKNPKAKILIITPTPWSIYPNSEVNNRMELYANKLIEVCRYRGIKCLDLYHCSGLIPTDKRHINLYYENNITKNVHPNDVGHRLYLAPPIREAIKTII